MRFVNTHLVTGLAVMVATVSSVVAAPSSLDARDISKCIITHYACTPGIIGDAQCADCNIGSIVYTCQTVGIESVSSASPSLPPDSLC